MKAYWYRATGKSGRMVCWHEDRESVCVVYADDGETIVEINALASGHAYVRDSTAEIER